MGRLPDGTRRASEGAEFCFSSYEKTACILGDGSDLSRREWKVSIQINIQIFGGFLYPSGAELAFCFLQRMGNF